MSGRLRVDLDMLRRTERELVLLAHAFRQARYHSDDAARAVGHHKVAAALDEFGGNWRRHRDALVSSLEAVAEMAGNGCAAYSDADQQLAAKLTEAGR